MGWTLSRSVYHALAGATAQARADGYPTVTAGHLIAAFLEDPGTVVSRAAPASGQMAASMKEALRVSQPSASDVWQAGSRPVPVDPAVGAAVLAAETGDEKPEGSGEVLLRLLSRPDAVAWRQLNDLGVEPASLVELVTRAIAAGDRDHG